MINGVTRVPEPRNETPIPHAPGSDERKELDAALKELQKKKFDFTMTIDGEKKMGSGEKIEVVQPHDHKKVLGTIKEATKTDAKEAVKAAKAAAPAWAAMPFDERAAVLLRAADLLCTKYRAKMNAATMLGQSKTIQQSEIDAIAELADFWRFNVAFAQQMMEQQPLNPEGQWNRLDYRPLDGFVYAISPFNFTAIGGNLPTAPALMGNTVIWKPSPTQQLSAHITMEILEEAGLPDGVINMLPGHGIEVSEVVLPDPDLAGVHFTGSTKTFQMLWKEIGGNIDRYRSYPRIVGETGGKDFILAHSSCDRDVLKTAIIRGAFEYQGQKCSAASRAYIAKSVWEDIKDDLATEVDNLAMGSPLDYKNFMSAVIDDRAFAKGKEAIDRAKANKDVEIVAGGTYDDSEGYFIRPTILECKNYDEEFFKDEYFNPILAVYVFDDEDFTSMYKVIDEASAYALTGAVLAKDRAVVDEATEALRMSAGNFYINDRPTGSVVGQQPFGGSRASGTNDKAGSMANLMRWTSPRSLKETLAAPTDHRYPHMS
ncbi:MAG: L-glutamate gamma-semialdehyde dehydrogenase [Micrococcaceae bacterium]